MKSELTNKYTGIGFLILTKNCLETLKKNIKFIKSFTRKFEINYKLVIVDSNSTDGTVEYLENFSKSEDLDLIRIDYLNNSKKNRVEKIAYCRDKGFHHLFNIFNDNFIYIPIDGDLDVFSLQNVNSFKEIVEFFQESAIQAMFPFSVPYYYDIFALRSVGWSEYNFQRASLLKKYKKLPSFYLNKKNIFNKQLKIKQFSNNLIEVESAFGGMGLYKILKHKKSYSYNSAKLKTGLYTDHCIFNENFDKKIINTKFRIEAPKEHIYYKNLNFFEKTLYVFKTIKHDYFLK